MQNARERDWDTESYRETDPKVGWLRLSPSLSLLSFHPDCPKQLGIKRCSSATSQSPPYVNTHSCARSPSDVRGWTSHARRCMWCMLETTGDVNAATSAIYRCLGIHPRPASSSSSISPSSSSCSNLMIAWLETLVWGLLSLQRSCALRQELERATFCHSFVCKLYFSVLTFALLLQLYLFSFVPTYFTY